MSKPEELWLLLDIGNTHTVAGLARRTASGRPVLESAFEIRYRTDASATTDEYRAQLAQLFAHRGIESLWKQITHGVLSSVVPQLEAPVRDCFGDLPFLKVDSRAARDFELKLPQPETLGADRLANVAGALTRYQPPFLIIDAGTATTFCLVDADRNYIGGAIVPGFETSFRALTSRAARLFSVELTRPDSAVGNTTETQLTSGMILGYEALLEGLTDRMLTDATRDHAGKFNDPTLIATGGCTRTLKLTKRFKLEPDLTLAGLLRYGELGLSEPHRGGNP
jgi:type III pantothenate kinase